MTNTNSSNSHLIKQIQDLQKRLRNVEETLEAIQKGEVDALVIFGAEGEKVYTLEGSDYIYRLLIEQMKEGAATLTPEGFILYCNQSLANFLQQPLEKLIGSNFQQFISPKDLAIFQKRLIHQQANETIYQELELISKEQKRIPVYLSLNQLTIEQTKIYYIVVTDLTQKKQNEEALRQSEEQFRNAFEYAPIGMALVGLDGRWLRVNPSFCQIVGYSEAELLTKTFQEITFTEDLELNLNYINQLVSGTINTYEIKTRYLHKNGQIVWVQLHGSVIRDSQGNPQRFISQIEDITQRQMMEQIKKDFISIVSHELRTPLTSIHGSLGLVASGVYDQKPDKMKKMLQIAVNQTNRLVCLVNDILSLQKLDSGRIKLVKEACNVTTLIQQSVETMRALAEQKQIILSVKCPNLEVWANSDSIIQVLINLLSNAIKFSPPHTTVVVSAELPESKQILKTNSSSNFEYLNSCYPYILFQVQDQGRGIPPDKLETIFEPFLQVDNSDSRSQGGTGLGLAICRSIIEQHEGYIWATSILGQGSTFYFTLPLSCEMEFS